MIMLFAFAERLPQQKRLSVPLAKPAIGSRSGAMISAPIKNV
jgi:hypothetical protein